ncbi:MAG: anti-sigma factor [Phycisphaerae bacterium]
MTHSCRQQIEQFLCDYVCGELPVPQRAEFEKHMADCKCCAAYLESYKKTIECERKSCCHKKNPELAEIPDDMVKAIIAARKSTSPDCD